jgi:hypothetical protein
MHLKDRIQIRIWKLLPPNFPTDLAEAFDDAKRAFWKAAAPAELSKEKMVPRLSAAGAAGVPGSDR